MNYFGRATGSRVIYKSYIPAANIQLHSYLIPHNGNARYKFSEYEISLRTTKTNGARKNRIIDGNERREEKKQVYKNSIDNTLELELRIGTVNGTRREIK